MKKEYIVAFGGAWYHFFIKPSQGLCVSKKEDTRFRFSACILQNAYDDFSVVATQKQMHVVCQDGSGAIVYCIFDGKEWHSQRLLESRDKMPAYKNLTLKLIGSFVNLFYVIKSKDDDCILVHQLLHKTAGTPKAVDYITGTDYSVCSHQTSDLTLLYRNAEGIYGTKKFRWSRKDFDGFRPLDCGCKIEHAIVTADENDHLQIAAYATFDKFVNILFLTKNDENDACSIAAVHLVSGESEGLAMARVGGSLSISWCENGLVMTASMTENNKWSTPKKYIKGTMQENVRYNIQSETECFATYGYQQDGRIMLYITRNILEHPPKEQNEEPQKKQPTPIDTNSGAFVPRSVYAADMAALRKLLASQNDIIVEMLKKITALERTAFPSESIAEDDGQLDRLAAENARTEELRKNQIAHVDERSTPQL